MKVTGPIAVGRTLEINKNIVSGTQATEDKAITGKGASQRDIPQNFRTIDPNRNEPITIGELELIEAIERANKTLVGINTNFKFSIHEDTKAIMVKVINSETQEVIREIPPEKILDMVAKMWELAGLIVDRHI
ncbi:MAG: flagellar protein FlaG [Caldicoprobacterales bacterium]|jgi:uncharacterized FlaG/YvyC family protein